MDGQRAEEHRRTRATAGGQRGHSLFDGTLVLKTQFVFRISHESRYANLRDATCDHDLAFNLGFCFKVARLEEEIDIASHWAVFAYVVRCYE